MLVFIASQAVTQQLKCGSYTADVKVLVPQALYMPESGFFPLCPLGQYD